jgi:hypothetical protein
LQEGSKHINNADPYSNFRRKMLHYMKTKEQAYDYRKTPFFDGTDTNKG